MGCAGSAESDRRKPPLLTAADLKVLAAPHEELTQLARVATPSVQPATVQSATRRTLQPAPELRRSANPRQRQSTRVASPQLATVSGPFGRRAQQLWSSPPEPDGHQDAPPEAPDQHQDTPLEPPEQQETHGQDTPRQQSETSGVPMPLVAALGTHAQDTAVSEPNVTPRTAGFEHGEADGEPAPRQWRLKLGGLVCCVAILSALCVPSNQLGALLGLPAVACCVGIGVKSLREARRSALGLAHWHRRAIRHAWSHWDDKPTRLVRRVRRKRLAAALLALRLRLGGTRLMRDEVEQAVLWRREQWIAHAWGHWRAVAWAPRAAAESWRAWRVGTCLLYTSPSPRDRTRSRMPSSA
eukprot:TRINITY_DN4279_c0_g2_i1.p1 TRINITY_DN4279_c0_g2~~TRINITY_DN4279_c0_g2_i1.p1  ORF type:complete len:355 (-),score=42.15 TRINITY_DN4279_c0_g2_i1:73-1137(-)